MHKVLLSFLLSSSVIVSCNTAPIKSPETADPIVANKIKPGTDTVAIVNDEQAVPDSIVNADSSQHLIITDTVSALKLPVVKKEIAISSNNQSVHFVIIDVKKEQLDISITHSKPDANIRISQVIDPDGSSDGPFGQQLNLKAKKKGNYVIVINKSNMASGSQVGNVYITVTRK